ncbi:MAG: respiratory nitrate reductase subunit gamma [Desulfobacteraceae bacterium]|nr:respiratory nitrate reductase subunit gamma [Desulfobacteraceae bacterium]
MKVSGIKRTIRISFLISAAFCLCLFTAEAVDRQVACQSCHESILEEIGNGSHMDSPLEEGEVYSKCENCHSACPEIQGPLVSVHDFSRSEEPDLCVKCHFSGNKARAVAMVLPYKSVLCMACHVSKWTIDDRVTLISLTAFLLALLALMTMWFTGHVKGAKENRLLSKLYHAGRMILRTLFSIRVFHLVKALILDALLQRRLFQQSKTRWAIHGLIFFPMVIRFFWALLAMGFSIWAPDQSFAPALLDKYHTLFGVLLFEITGLLPILGMILLAMRKVFAKSEPLKGLPSQGRWAYYLLGSIFITGYVLRGMQIAVTGFPAGSEVAFLSFGVATLMKGLSHLSEIHGYVWYIHAILWGLFVASMPFGRMFHIVMAPIAVMIREMHQKKNSI